MFRRSFLCLKICSLINEVFVFTPNIFGIYNFELACCSLLLHTFEKFIFHFYLLILFTHLVFIYFETFNPNQTDWAFLTLNNLWGWDWEQNSTNFINPEPVKPFLRKFVWVWCYIKSFKKYQNINQSRVFFDYIIIFQDGHWS